MERKERVGDWEADTIIGKGHSGAVVSLVDRASKYTPLPLQSATPAIPAARATPSRREWPEGGVCGSRVPRDPAPERLWSLLYGGYPGRPGSGRTTPSLRPDGRESEILSTPFRHPGPSSTAEVPPAREGPGVRVALLCPAPLLMEINQVHAVPMADDDPDGRSRRPAAHGRREGDVRTARWYAVRDLQPLVEDSIERSWLQTP